MAIDFPKIIAHKSYITGFIGNTYQAVQAAVSAGVKAIEIDIRRTKDNIPVVFHDEDMDPSTNFSGPVRAYTAQEIVKAKYSSKDLAETEHPVSLLESVLRDFGQDLIIFLEIKEGSLPLIRSVIDLIRKYNLEHRVVIESFSVDCLYKSRRLAPTIPIMLAYTYDVTPITYEETEVDHGEGSWLWTQKWFQKFMRPRLKPDYLAPRFNVPRSEIKQLMDQGEKLIIWTVDDVKTAEELFDLGVTAVMTNCYENLKSL